AYAASRRVGDSEGGSTAFGIGSSARPAQAAGDPQQQPEAEDGQDQLRGRQRQGDVAILDRLRQALALAHGADLRSAARAMASMIFVYPVQRQRLPAIASRMFSSVALAPESRNAWPAISIPGVQIPHCAPPVSRNACWSAPRVSSGASPSTVRTDAPRAWLTGTRHASTTAP